MSKFDQDKHVDYEKLEQNLNVVKDRYMNSEDS